MLTFDGGIDIISIWKATWNQCHFKIINSLKVRKFSFESLI